MISEKLGRWSSSATSTRSRWPVMGSAIAGSLNTAKDCSSSTSTGKKYYDSQSLHCLSPATARREEPGYQPATNWFVSTKKGSSYGAKHSVTKRPRRGWEQAVFDHEFKLCMGRVFRVPAGPEQYSRHIGRCTTRLHQPIVPVTRR